MGRGGCRWTYRDHRVCSGRGSRWCGHYDKTFRGNEGERFRSPTQYDVDRFIGSRCESLVREREIEWKLWELLDTGIRQDALQNTDIGKLQRLVKMRLG